MVRFYRPLVSEQNENWMCQIGGQKLLSSLMVPGIHDIACQAMLVPFSTQGMNIGSQLLAGIRYQDLRCKVENPI
jgi:hypothetical protein